MPEAKSRIVVKKIRSDIESGLLREGNILPSSRDLAFNMGVGLSTISRAMKILEEEGVIASYDRRFRVVKSSCESLKRGSLIAPRIVLIGGRPGVGKGDVGQLFARMSGWCLINKRTIVRPVAEGVFELLRGSSHENFSDSFSETIKILEYETLLATAKENVSCGNSIIVVAPFTRQFQDRSIMDRIIQGASQWGARVDVVHVIADDPIRRQRIFGRSLERGFGGASKSALSAAYLTAPPNPVVDHFVVKNTGSSTKLEEDVRGIFRKVLS